MEVILRNNVVESARAGDEMTFVGTLLVVPDVAAITAPGEKVQTKLGMHFSEVVYLLAQHCRMLFMHVQWSHDHGCLRVRPGWLSRARRQWSEDAWL